MTATLLVLGVFGAAAAASPGPPAAPLKVVYVHLVGGPEIRAVDEVLERRLGDLPEVSLMPEEQSAKAFDACRGEASCAEKAAQALGADRIVLGMAGLDRDTWLLDLACIDRNGVALRHASARWPADASSLGTLADVLLHDLLGLGADSGSIAVAPVKALAAGLALSLDGSEPKTLRPDQPAQTLAPGPHRLTVVGSAGPADLFLRAAPHQPLLIWASVADGTARVFPADAPLPSDERGVTIAVRSEPRAGGTIPALAAFGSAVLLGAGAGIAGGSYSQTLSRLNALTATGAVDRSKYVNDQATIRLDEGLGIGLGSAALVAAGVGVWFLAGL